MIMKELLKKLEDVVQESGYQCIRIKDYYDFSQKLNCMGGEYKGFVMTDEPEKLCMLYIDTVEMEKEADKKYNEISRLKINISPENKVYVSNMPQEYVKKITDYTTLGFYLRATKEFNRFYYEKEAKENRSIFSKIKDIFKKR